MSAAAQADGAPPKKSNKKLIIIVALALLLVGGAGGGYFFLVKKKADAAAAAEDGEEEAAPVHKPARDSHKPPTYVALDPFVVNLADKDADRFAQIGVTLQVDDSKFADEMKVFMPAVRNGILMVLAHKTSEQLLARSGKQALVEEIMRAAARPMGIEFDDEDDEAAPSGKAAHGDDEAPAKPSKKKRKKKPVHNPISDVLFSNFIIQ